MKISIVIPNFNGRQLLKKNLPLILKHCPDQELIIVDDASTDGSVLEVKSQKLKVKSKDDNLKIIQNRKNLGFASSVNIGVKQSKGDLIVLLNTDVYPDKNYLDHALSHFKDSQIFAVGFLQKSIEGNDIILRGRGVGKFERGFLVHRRGEVDKVNTLWVSGGACAVRKDIWERLGGMSTIYNPFYWEDIDLSYRALKAGYKLIFEPKSIVYHQQKEGAIRSLYTPSQIKTIAYRNQIFFVWCNITDKNLILQHYIYLPYHLLKSLLRFDIDFTAAFFLTLAQLPKVLHQRTRNKKLNEYSDLDILSHFTS